MKIKNHVTAGCYLVRRKKGVWEIVLICKRWPDNSEGWVPPKGHLEDGESFEEAAKRETSEETGYRNMEIIQPLATLNIEYPWNDGYTHKKSIHYFLAKLLSDEKPEQDLSDDEKDEIIKVEWMNLDKARKALRFDDEREILVKVIEILRSL